MEPDLNGMSGRVYSKKILNVMVVIQEMYV
jgi:hypothetical protein